MNKVLALAGTYHNGYTVYKSKDAVVHILREVEKLHVPWWSARCSAFVRAVEKAPLLTDLRHSHPVIVVEGLDGVGKTLITKTLAGRLEGVVECTPPSAWEDIRPLYRGAPAAIARCFYSGANYLAAEQIVRAAVRCPVIVDRWWCSTCAMALANERVLATLPPEADKVYRWPADLANPDAGYVVYVDEPTRQRRIKARAPEDAEEQRLSAMTEMRRTAMEAFRRTNRLVPVEAVTYRVAVNTILRDLETRGLIKKAKLFTAAELDEIKPY